MSGAAARWAGEAHEETGHTTRPQAWLAYQLWLGALLAKHDDAGLEASVKITKADDGTWTLRAEVRPCSVG